MYDVAIVGGGPAGLTSAIYTLRNNKKTVIIERSVFGGQIVNSAKVENIPGFDVIAGDEYGDLLLKQVKKLGGNLIFDDVTGADLISEGVVIKLSSGEEIMAKTLILATGTKHRTLNLLNEENLIGKNIHFCAICDGSFYKDKDVVVIGGGNSAFTESLILKNNVRKLTILQNLPYFTAFDYLQKELLEDESVAYHLNVEIKEYVVEDGVFKGLKYIENDKEEFVDCAGVFLSIGMIPDNYNFENLVDLDKDGYFISDEYGNTKSPNVFVAGDCRNKKLRQVATAIGDGANSAIGACDFLKRVV